jgi:hypothetical protein
MCSRSLAQLFQFSPNLVSKTKCILSVKIEMVQLLESGIDIAKVADWSFED